MKTIASFIVIVSVLEQSFLESSRGWICWNAKKGISSNNVKFDAGFCFVHGSRGVIAVANAFEHRQSHFCRNKDGNIRSRGMLSKPPLEKGHPLPSPFPMSSSPLLVSYDNDDDEILSMDAITLSNAIQRERSVTCEQVMKATLDRIDEINPTLNAIILLRDKTVLLEEARDCDRELKAQFERDSGSRSTNVEFREKENPFGWLYGIPIAIKDVSNAKGLATTMGGSPLFCSENGLTPADSNDPYVENMIRDGAIVIGKTNAPEGGLGSNTFNKRWGKTLNPFAAMAATAASASDCEKDTESHDAAVATDSVHISAGGSSGGAAVAIATKMLVLADGTDNMGSLRNPAGWNNIYSLRPTAGLIPARQTATMVDEEGPTSASTSKSTGTTTTTSSPSVGSILPHPASTPGPMARTPKDCARLLQSMVGDAHRFEAESLWTKFPKEEDLNSNPAASKPIRIGWLGDWKGRLPMEDGILSTCQQALEDWSAASFHSNSNGNSRGSRIVLKSLRSGDDTNPLMLFDLDKLWEAYNTIRFASTYETYSQQFDVNQLLSTKEGRKLIKEELAWELEQGRSIDANALQRARAVYDEYEEWLHGSFVNPETDQKNSFDVLALPSAQVWPFPIENRYPKVIGETKMDTYHRWMEVCVPVSFGGLPSVTVPAGFGHNPKGSGPALPPLPIGIQLFGKKGDDGKLLRLANEYYLYRCGTAW